METQLNNSPLSLLYTLLNSSKLLNPLLLPSFPTKSSSKLHVRPEKMRKCLSFLILAFLLLHSAEGRLLAPSPTAASDLDLDELSVSAVDECKDLEKEECLIRRAMVVHTDYVYTQDIINQP